MNKSVYPSNAEVVEHNSYSVQKTVDSKYIPNGKTTVEVGTKCPSCDHINGVMVHSDYLKCPKCKLRMQLFGNGLHIWR